MYEFWYHVTEDDYWKLNEHAAFYTEAGRKRLRVYQCAMPLFWLALAALVVLYQGATLLLIAIEAVTVIILTALWVAFSKKMMARAMKKGLQKMKASGRLPYSQEGALTFGENDILDRSKDAETRIAYALVEKIYEYKDAVYVYYSAAQGFIMPGSCFENGEQKREFLAFLREKTGKHAQGGETAC